MLHFLSLDLFWRDELSRLVLALRSKNDAVTFFQSGNNFGLRGGLKTDRDIALFDLIGAVHHQDGPLTRACRLNYLGGNGEHASCLLKGISTEAYIPGTSS